MLPVWDLRNRFTLHQTSAENAQKRELIRSIAHSYATVINETVPDCREKNLAITKLEEVVFWANAALARYDAAKNEDQAWQHKEEPKPTQNRTM
jgi:hypothetical protein